MTSKSVLDFDDNKVTISNENWNDLVREKSTIPICGIAALAAEIIQKNGAFIINGDIGIIRRCDRLSELKELLGEADKLRASLGLSPR